KSVIGKCSIFFFSISLPHARTSATKAPVIEAVLVPPSAWITSQSIQIVRSPIKSRSTTLRSARPIRRWISIVLPLTLPREDSRIFRCSVALGSIAYSAVIHPLFWPRMNGGTLSSMLALLITFVFPNSIKPDPSGCVMKFGVIVTGLFSCPLLVIFYTPANCSHFSATFFQIGRNHFSSQACHRQSHFRPQLSLCFPL